MGKEGKYGQLDTVWRLQIGLAIIPALVTLWPRLTMPEGKKYLESRSLNKTARPDSVNSTKSCSTVLNRHKSTDSQVVLTDGRGLQAEIDAQRAEIDALAGRRARLDIFFVYFRQWRHLRTLIGTASCWFLLDVVFYGTNLNQSVILSSIGFSTGKNEYDMLKRNAVGNIIICVAGYLRESISHDCHPVRRSVCHSWLTTIVQYPPPHPLDVAYTDFQPLQPATSSPYISSRSSAGAGSRSKAS